MYASEWMDQFVHDLIEHYEAEVLPSGLIYLELSMGGYGVLVVEEKIKRRQMCVCYWLYDRQGHPVSHLVGQTLTARLHLDRIDLFDGIELVASHPRQYGRHLRVVVPEHFEAVFARKPRARVMVYRDWLVGLSPVVATYISQVCYKYYEQMESQILPLYALAREVGEAAFVAAVERAADQAAIGFDYVSALIRQMPAGGSPPGAPGVGPPAANALPAWLAAPPQGEVERALSHYEQYVSNATVSLTEEGEYELARCA